MLQLHQRMSCNSPHRQRIIPRTPTQPPQEFHPPNHLHTLQHHQVLVADVDMDEADVAADSADEDAGEELVFSHTPLPRISRQQDNPRHNTPE